MKKVLPIGLVLISIFTLFIISKHSSTEFDKLIVPKDSDISLVEVIENFDFENNYEQPYAYIIIEDDEYEIRKYQIADEKTVINVVVPKDKTITLSLHENRTIAGKWLLFTDSDYDEFESNTSVEQTNGVKYGYDTYRRNFSFVVEDSSINIKLLYQLESEDAATFESEFVFDVD